jgi:glutaconate CoA-transferase subunit B
VPEIFNYWLQGGRIDVGFLGAAQIDRYGNLNSTVIGSYEAPKVRLPGGGGAPEIATLAREVIVIMRQTARAFVERLHFRSSLGFGDGPGERERLGISGAGPTVVITDLGVLRAGPVTRELTLTQVHPGVTVDQVREATGWPLAVAGDVAPTPAPTDAELEALRALQAARSRTAA